MTERAQRWTRILITACATLEPVGPTTAHAFQGAARDRAIPKRSARFERPPRLDPGTSADTDIARGGKRAFQVRLEAGQFLNLEVLPKGIALRIDVVDPSGAAVRRIESSYTSEGPQAVFLVAATPGHHTIEVRATEKGGLTGHFSIHFAPPRTATEEDRARSAGQQALSEGMRLYKQGTSDALKRSIAKYEQAVELWRGGSDSKGAADTLVALGMALCDLGENRRALAPLHTALESFQALGDARGEAGALHNLGEAEDAMGEERDALSHYAEALALRKSVGDRLAEAETLNNIGVVYDSMGDKPRALDHLQQSLVLKDALQLHRFEGTLLNNIGWVKFTSGDMEGALDSYRQALPLRHAEGDLHGESVTLTNIGSVYLTIGDARTAMAYYRRAQPIANRVGNTVWSATLSNNIGFALSTPARRTAPS